MTRKSSVENYILRVFIPGFDAELLNIEAAQKAIAISGKTNRPQLSEGDKYLYSELSVGEFHRVINLPEAIAHTEVQADYTDGILTVILSYSLNTTNDNEIA